MIIGAINFFLALANRWLIKANFNSNFRTIAGYASGIPAADNGSRIVLVVVDMVLISDDGGDTWSTSSKMASAFIASQDSGFLLRNAQPTLLVWQASWNLFVCIGYAQNSTTTSYIYCFTSPDGITWTNRPSIATAFGAVSITNLPAAGGYLIDGSLMYVLGHTPVKSTDGITWTADSNLKTALFADAAQHISTAGIKVSSRLVVIAQENGSTALSRSAYSDDSGATWSYNAAYKTAYTASGGNIQKAYSYGPSIIKKQNGHIVVFGTGSGGVSEATSSDGATFTFSGTLLSASGGSSLSTNNVIWDGAQYVALSAYGADTTSYIMTSTDFATWSKRTNFGAVIGSNIFYGGSKIRVLLSTSMRTSSDSGATWGDDVNWAATNGSSSYVKSVASNNGSVILAVGGNYWHVARSGDAGETWTSMAAAYSAQGAQGAKDVVYSSANGGRYFILSADIARVVRTTGNDLGDTFAGITNIATAGFSGTVQGNAMVVGVGYIIIAGENGKLTRISDIATPVYTATTFTVFGTTPIRGLAHNGSVAVAVGDSGKAAYSTDAPNATWNSAIASMQAAVSTNNMMSVAWGASKFCAVGQLGYIATSPDGITWTNRASGASVFGTGTILKIRWVVDRFIAMSKENIWGESADGITWTQNTSPVKFTSNVGDNAMDVVPISSSAAIISVTSDGNAYKTSI